MVWRVSPSRRNLKDTRHSSRPTLEIGLVAQFFKSRRFSKSNVHAKKGQEMREFLRPKLVFGRNWDVRVPKGADYLRFPVMLVLGLRNVRR